MSQFMKSFTESLYSGVREFGKSIAEKWLRNSPGGSSSVGPRAAHKSTATADQECKQKDTGEMVQALVMSMMGSAGTFLEEKFKVQAGVIRELQDSTLAHSTEMAAGKAELLATKEAV
jgi:hypothetical protein